MTREFFYNGDGKLESVTVDGEKEWQLSYEDSLLNAVSHYDIRENPSIKEKLPYNTNVITGNQFVNKYIKEYIGVEFPDKPGDWTIVYGGSPQQSGEEADENINDAVSGF